MQWQKMSKDEKFTEISRYVKGGKSLNYISKLLHTSRGAIQGFSHRNGIECLFKDSITQGKRTPRGINNNPSRRHFKPYKPTAPVTVHPGAFHALPGSIPVTLMERTGCCWPVDGGVVQLFCDLECGGTYCDVHTNLSRRLG